MSTTTSPKPSKAALAIADRLREASRFAENLAETEVVDEVEVAEELEALLDAPLAAEPVPCANCGDGITAGAEVTIDPTNPGRFKSVLAVEDERTADSRMIMSGATKWRPTPLPLMLMTKTADGHDGSEVCGVIETITRDGKKIVGEGRFDTGESGIEAARLVANQVLTGVSIDAGDVEGEIEVEAAADDGTPTAILAKMTAITILGATIVPFPAIGSTSIMYLEPLADDDVETLATDEARDALVAAGPRAYPAGAFADPDLDGLTSLQVVPVEGQDDLFHIFGHAAPWGTCHIGFPGTCVTPPKSQCNYSHFLTGSAHLVEGGTQAVGTITLNTSHAEHRLSMREAAMHYDHTGTAAAFVNVGEDAYGIWFSGVLRPGLTEEDATVFAASSMSGDWRNVGGNLELVAVLSVNTPGFPVAYTHDDEQVALVAAGYGPVAPTRSHAVLAAEKGDVDRLGERMSSMQEEIDALRRLITPIARERVERRLNQPSDADD